MPFGDGTGPAGMGPMTGRGAGFCSGFSAPGYTGAAPARRWFNVNWFGFGRRPRWGRGRGGRWFAGYRNRW